MLIHLSVPGRCRGLFSSQLPDQYWDEVTGECCADTVSDNTSEREVDDSLTNPNQGEKQKFTKCAAQGAASRTRAAWWTSCSPRTAPRPSTRSAGAPQWSITYRSHAQSLVPSQHQESSAQEKMDELENHLVSHGLNQVEFEAGRRTIHVRVCCP